MEPKKRDKIWNIRHAAGDEARERAIAEISGALDVSRYLAILLYNRGYTDPDTAGRFLRNEESLLHDPFLLKDIDRAVSEIGRAIGRGDKITIYGDYDVDGVTSVSLLWLYLRSKGAEVDYYIPSRSGEGYGLSFPAIDSLKNGGTELIITVDTGITANEEIAYAASLGIGTVLTDHHECRSELPEALAVVNPHRPDCEYPFKDLAGVGVVFKLICAYEMTEARERGESDIDALRRVCLECSDLTAIGTVADVMPITDENRLIVAMGIRMIASTKRPGLAALIDAASAPRVAGSAPVKRRKITSSFIGYGIAPRINAAGRISSASTAVRLLLAQNEAEAAALARELCEINSQRQLEENRIAEQAMRKIEREFDFERDRVIVLEDDGWQQGIIGIVSSRITERFGLPSVLISFDGSTRGYISDDDSGKGSGRGVKGMNLVEALTFCEDLLIKYGGHELAAGLTIERSRVPEFRRRINDYAREKLREEDMAVNLEADCILTPGELTLDFAAELYRLEPYGVSNPVPSFILYDVPVSRIIPVGGGKHTKLIVGEGARGICAMCFGTPPSRLPLGEGESADLLFTLDINEYHGTRSVQLIVQDIRRSRRSEADEGILRRRYEEVSAGGSFDAEENFIPDREDFAAVYRLLLRESRLRHNTHSERTLLATLRSSTSGRDINYVKLMYILRVFRELKICEVEELGEGIIGFDISYSPGRTSIERSGILKKLRIQCRNRG